MAVEIRVVSAEITREGAYLLAQRSSHATLPLLWEFPGGKVREGESDEDALHRAFEERLGCSGTIGERVLEVVHHYEGYDLHLVVYRCALDAEPKPVNVAALEWVRAEDFGGYTFPGADQKSIDLLLDG